MNDLSNLLSLFGTISMRLFKLSEELFSVVSAESANTKFPLNKKDRKIIDEKTVFERNLKTALISRSFSNLFKEIKKTL